MHFIYLVMNFLTGLEASSITCKSIFITIKLVQFGEAEDKFYTMNLSDITPYVIGIQCIWHIQYNKAL